MCAIEGPTNLLAPLPVSQSGPDAWISEIRDYLKENIHPEDHVSAERIVRLAKRCTMVEGGLYRPRKRAIIYSRRSMEGSVEVILHPARWSVRPSGMVFIGQLPSRMRPS